MKLLLDEMWTPTIALELRQRAFDVIAANEAAHASRYAGTPDDAVFALAQDDGRTIVTDNVSDYERARLAWESRGHAHHGVIYALDPPSNRHRGPSVIGEIVRALEHLLRSPEAAPQPVNRVFYLRQAPEPERPGT
jgi:hypothetical protein